MDHITGDLEDTLYENPQDRETNEEEEEKQSSDINVPKSLITCPITGKLMIDPVCVNGQDYERTAIMEYIFKNDKDPKG